MAKVAVEEKRIYAGKEYMHVELDVNPAEEVPSLYLVGELVSWTPGNLEKALRLLRETTKSYPENFCTIFLLRRGQGEWFSLVVGVEAEFSGTDLRDERGRIWTNLKEEYKIRDIDIGKTKFKATHCDVARRVFLIEHEATKQRVWVTSQEVEKHGIAEAFYNSYYKDPSYVPEVIKRKDQKC